jgi:hypothetical protein
MATKKATTTADLTAEEYTAKAEDPQPTREELVEQVTEATDPEMVADVDQPKTHKVKSPLGAVTEVPESILDALLESGYSKTR